MIIPEEVICKTCEKVFCCPECREKHEVKAHGILIQCVEPVVHIFCPICQNKPLILHKTMHNELFIHITENHLPLNCQKCSRLYTKLEDLMEFSKCIQSNVPCKLEISEEPKIDVESRPENQQQKLASSVSTQTSPVLLREVHNVLTPISMINLRWKAKTKVAEEYVGDSVSSIKNISSINNSTARRSIEIGIHSMKGKLVRSTSTPLQAEIFPNSKEQAFNATGGHVSSIYSSASEPENSPPLLLPVGSTPSNKIGETVNRYQKPRCRSKMYLAVTPLRQVMSKSIQKAIAEHGIAGKMRGVGLNRKKMFDSANSSCDISEKNTENYPLDLRLSPALRRTQSEIIDRKHHLELLRSLPKTQPQIVHREILLSSTKKTTESIVITSRKAESVTDNINGSNSVYKSCQSVEIVTSTSTELSELKTEQSDVVLEADESDSFSVMPHITPRIPNSGVFPNKKLIKFETPVVVQKCSSENHSPDEQFFTPSSTPLRASKMYKKFQQENSNIRSMPRNYYSIEEQIDRTDSSSSDYTDVNLDDEVFIEDKKTEKGRGNLWKLVASMIRLPSLSLEKGNEKLKNRPPLSENSTSLIQRCASFAGSLVRQNSFSEESSQSLKRKRSNTAGNLLHNFSSGDCTDLEYTCSESKRLRIQGRRPIQRMQYNK